MDLLQRGETVEAVLAHVAHVFRFLHHLSAQMLLEMSSQIVQSIEDPITHLAAHGVILICRARRILLMALQMVRAISPSWFYS